MDTPSPVQLAWEKLQRAGLGKASATQINAIVKGQAPKVKLQQAGGANTVTFQGSKENAPTAELAPLSSSDLTSRCGKLLHQLKDVDRGTRARALEGIQVSLCRHSSLDWPSPTLAFSVTSPVQEACCSGAAIDAGTTAEILSSWLGKALLKLFADPCERVRTLAVTLFGASIRQGPDAILELLPYITPVLEERLQAEERASVPAERSEEIRVKLLEVLPSLMFMVLPVFVILACSGEQL